MSAEIILDPGGSNEQKITKDEIREISPKRVHTGMSRFRARLGTDTSYISAVQRQDRVNIKFDGSVVYTGYVTDITIDKNSPVTTLKGVGIAKKLEENRPDYSSLGGSLTYTSKALDEAIRDYWGRTSFSSFNVTDQSTSSVVSDSQIQSADTTTEWNNLTPSFGADEPVGVKSGKLKNLQAGFVGEAENATLSAGASTINNAGSYSSDDAVKLDAKGEWVEFEFSPEYDIPDGEYTIGTYSDFDNFDGTVSIFVNDTTNAVTTSTHAGASSSLAAKLQVNDVNQGKLDAASNHFVRVECTDYTSGQWNVDVIFCFDDGDRHGGSNITVSTNFDSSSASFSDPQKFYESYTTELNSKGVSFNITGQKITSNWNNTDNKQRLSVSLDDGTNYKSGSNTTSIDKSWSSKVGRKARMRVRFGRHDGGSVTTPTTGGFGQQIDDIQHKVDGNDRAVIDDLELTRNHFENLQQLHEYGDFLWTIEHSDKSISNMVVESYQRGDKTASKPNGFDDPIEKTVEIAAKSYYNTIFVQGAKPSSGSRPTAEVKDSSLVSNDGREISPGVLRDPKITTEGGAAYRARTLLDNATDNNSRFGSLTVPLTVADPGYARPVDLGNGDVDKVVERVDVTLNPDSATATFELTPPEQIADEIANLKRRSRDISDQV